MLFTHEWRAQTSEEGTEAEGVREACLDGLLAIPLGGREAQGALEARIRKRTKRCLSSFVARGWMEPPKTWDKTRSTSALIWSASDSALKWEIKVLWHRHRIHGSSFLMLLAE